MQGCPLGTTYSEHSISDERVRVAVREERGNAAGDEEPATKSRESFRNIPK